ncbi:ComF family protein [Ferruginibacter sp.]
MRSFTNILYDTLHLFYPHICTGCGSDLLPQGNQLCVYCINDLPHTNFAQFANNPIEKIFWARIPVTAAHSEFYFAKETLLQHLIHQLKYKNNTDIGIYLGEMMGNSLLQSGRFSQLDYLVPLPLYPDKERKRGYNQAAVICKGISEIMQVPVLNDNVVRRRFTETQTRKHRTERWENVEGSFVVNDPTVLQGKKILLVDDVVTTGATLEACGSTILQVPGTKLYIATLAYATK